MKDYDLERFVKNQVYDYPKALEEIKAGRKKTHWIWYIFPQLKGLGTSYNSQYFGIENAEEAECYLSHPVIGSRLREISSALLSLNDSDPVNVMGEIDSMKLHSSMTLFASISENDSVFHKVLDKFFDGKMDSKTLEILKH